MSINPEDVTFVIQGPLGTIREERPEHQSAKTALREMPETVVEQSIHNIREHFPKAKILISTWEGQDASDLNYDSIVFSKDPGSNITRYERDNSPYRENMNRQIVSTLNGLKRVATKYAVKIRSDNVLHSNKILTLHEQFPARSEECRFLKERIVTSNQWAHEFTSGFPVPFFVSDFFQFGLTEDLIQLWDVPLEEDYLFNEALKGCKQSTEYPWPKLCVEQKLFSRFVSKFHSFELKHKHDVFRGNKQLSDLCIANNLIIIESDALGLEVLDRTKHTNDLTGRFYSHLRWQQLYQRYSAPSFTNPELDAFKKIYYRSRVGRFFAEGLKTIFRLLRCRVQSWFIKT